MTNCKEILGLKKIAFYINNNVRYNFPDPAVENEIDLIAHAEGSIVVSDSIELPKWERILTFSGNYKQNYFDEFSFIAHGILNNVPGLILAMRNNRLGYITEIITTSNRSFVFPVPVFLNAENTKQVDSHSWNVSLSYRIPTFQDHYTKLNTLLMIYSYILVGDNQILGSGGGVPIVAN